MRDDYVLLSADEFDDVRDDLMTRKVVGLDFETTGLDPRRDVPLLLGIDEYIFPCWQDGDWVEAVRPLVESQDVVKVEYNASFEGMIFQAAGIRQRRVVDPMLGDQLLHIGRPPGTKFNLGAALKRYLYVEHDKSLQTSFVGADPATFVPTDAQCRYLRRDVGYLPQLSEAVARRIAAEGMMDTWRLENQYSQVVAMMQYHGVLVDVEGYQQELEKVNAEFDVLERQVSEALTPHILEVRRRKYQAMKVVYDTWAARRDAQKELMEAALLPAMFPTAQERRDCILARMRDWRAFPGNKKPQNAKMNHSPILVTSPAQIHLALNELGVQVQDTEKETLVMARATYPQHSDLLKLLGEMAVVKKVRSNEGPELLERLYDGTRLTTRYGQLKTRTGRLASASWRDKGRCGECGASVADAVDDDGTTDITCGGCGRTCGRKNFGKLWGANKQNLTTRLKRHVVPGPGRKFVIYDYSQIELRVTADLILRENPAATDALVKAFRDGLDPHCLTGEEVTGTPYEEFHRIACVEQDPDSVKLRRGMKEVNFGASFGIGAPLMAVKIYVKTGDTSLFGQGHIDRSQLWLDAFWRVNPTFAALRDRIGDEAITNGFVETLGGRRRYFESAGMNHWQKAGLKRQAISTRIQGTAADIAKDAQNRIYAALEADPEAWLWSATHDEIALECDEDVAADWDQVVPACMDRAFGHYIRHIESGIKPGTGIHETWTH